MNRSLKLVLTTLAIGLLAALVVSIATPAQAQTGGDITLVAFDDPSMGIKGVTPEGWTQVAPGTFRRMTDESDLVMLIQQAAAGFTVDNVTVGLLSQLGLEALPEVATSIETESLSWDLYRLEVEAPEIGTVVLDLALSPIEEPVTTHIVMLQSLSDDRDALYEGVLLPAVEAYSPQTANWGQPDGPAPIAEDFAPARLEPQVISTRPHDPTSFTQGLLYYDGSLYESDGNCCPSYSTFSTLREVDPETGEVLRSIDIDPQYFTEGLERVGDRLIQLTWQENTAFVYDIETFEVVDTYTYEGEGWGLCYDGDLLYMSDGSPYITLRDPETFEVIDRGLVTFQGLPAEQINELECVGDYIYANIWQADVIIQIDKTNGNVVGVIDAQNLLSEEELASITPGSDVLNGIVYLPESDTFLITGKQWPTMFEVTFEEVAEEGGE